MTKSDTRAALIAWGEAPRRIAELQEQLKEITRQAVTRRDYLLSPLLDGMPHAARGDSPTEIAALRTDAPMRIFLREKRNIETEIVRVKENESAVERALKQIPPAQELLLRWVYRRGLSRQHAAIKAGRSLAWAYKAEHKAVQSVADAIAAP